MSCLEGTHSGRLLFSGGADGLLMCHDLRMKEPSRVLWHHNAGVNGLALEDPWLVSTASGVYCVQDTVQGQGAKGQDRTGIERGRDQGSKLG